MNEIINTLEALNLWMKSEGITGSLTYRGEVSHNIRCGRNQISLNNSEVGERFFIDLQEGKKTASASLTGDASERTKIKEMILSTKESLRFMPEKKHLKELRPISQGDLNQHVADSKITNMDSGLMVDLFKSVAFEFASEEVELSGSFSAGSYSYSTINTKVAQAVSYQGSDFNVEVVLQLTKHDKKEIRSAQVGENLKTFSAKEMIDELSRLYKIKTDTKRTDLPAGEYDVVFSSHAFAELTNYMSYLTFHGESHEFKSSMLCLDDQKVGSKIFGKNVTIIDDPSDPDILFSRAVGINGVSRHQFPLIEKGVLSNMFYSDKETCDRFSIEVNNDFSVASIKVHPGKGPQSFDEVIASCQRPTIYIPFIHYMNFTNPARGEFTGTSRFGTFLISDGKIQSHLFNVRLNDSYMRIFNNIEWLSSSLEHVNTSDSYGMRMAASIACPSFVKVNNIKISGSSAPDRG